MRALTEATEEQKIGEKRPKGIIGNEGFYRMTSRKGGAMPEGKVAAD